MTTTTQLVLRALLAADEPTWGYQIITATGLRSGTVYPVLGRLAANGWTTTSLETTVHPGRPLRRLHTFTPAGRLQAEAALGSRPQIRT